MAWTDPAPELGRSRDELLADVVRRGARMRRRRRTGTAMAAAMALAIPVTLLVAAVGTSPDRRVNLTVAGPSVTDAGAPVTTSAVPVLPPDLAADAPTTTVRRRGSTPLAPPTTLVLPGVAAAGPSSTAPVELRPDPADATPTTGAAAAPVDPSGRPAPPPGGFGSSTAAGSGQATGVAASTTVPPGTAGTGADAPLADCAAADVAVTVATENPTYAPGDTVRGFSMLENRSATACLLPTRSFFHVQDASGATVSNFSYTADYRLPVRAEPGRTVTDGFAWDQRNCSPGPCAQVPAGTYTVVAEWTEGGTYRGRSSFRVG